MSSAIGLSLLLTLLSGGVAIFPARLESSDGYQ